MKVKELIKLLQKEDPDKPVIIAAEINGLGIVDDIISVDHNGLAIQLSGESLDE